MHYRNGRVANNGDKVIQISTDDKGRITAVGTLIDAVPGNDYCNGMIYNSELKGATGACLCDCLNMEDVSELLKEKGWHKRPTGK